MGFGPQLADLDGDGTVDLVSGSYPGDVHLFRGLGKGEFAAPSRLLGVDGKPVNAGRAAAVAVVDWNQDGRLDLVIGDIHGDVFLCSNEGTSLLPAFGEPKALRAAGEPVHVDSDAGPSIADWDGDGRPDLLLGSGDGSVRWFRNVGSRAGPQMDAPIELIPHSILGAQSGAGDPTRPALRTKVTAFDWNGDGLLDLLVGDARILIGPKLPTLSVGADEALPHDVEVHGNVWVYLRRR